MTFSVVFWFSVVLEVVVRIPDRPSSVQILSFSSQIIAWLIYCFSTAMLPCNVTLFLLLVGNCKSKSKSKWKSKSNGKCNSKCNSNGKCNSKHNGNVIAIVINNLVSQMCLTLVCKLPACAANLFLVLNSKLSSPPLLLSSSGPNCSLFHLFFSVPPNSNLFWLFCRLLFLPHGSVCPLP